MDSFQMSLLCTCVDSPEGVSERIYTSFPGFPSRSLCILPEGFLGVCLPSPKCAFMEAQLGHAADAHDVELWRHLRRFVCGFDVLAPRFCCPHPQEAFYDFPGRPDEVFIRSVFEAAEVTGGGSPPAVIVGGSPAGTGRTKPPGRSTTAQIKPAASSAAANKPPLPLPPPS
jgi:hypothetical protein